MRHIWMIGFGVMVACGGEPTPAPAPKAKAAKSAKKDKAKSKGKGKAFDRSQLAAFAPLPKRVKGEEKRTKARVDLGRMLYFDKRLSKNHDVSCNTCHDLAKYGVDGAPTSTGHKGQKGGRNAPTVYNAAGHVAQFWDGRAKDLVEQAKGPPLNPIEMAMKDEAHVETVLRSIPGYKKAFKEAFPEDKKAVSFQNMAEAIADFERKLITPGRWDQFLEGDDSALTPAEKKGLKTFISSGCVACHSGPFMGGTSYQKVGTVKPWPNQKDQGRFEVSKKDVDKMMFKVPSLRNIEKTGPYFHDGEVKGLDRAVKMMARHQLGKELTDEESGQIVTFLKALTGDLPKKYIAEPELPKSGPDTPKPDPT